MSEEAQDFHFNVNVRTDSGSKATMANNEDSFLRAMEIQERKRAKKELERPKEEEIIEASTTENAEPALIEEEVIQEKVAAPVEKEPLAVELPPAKPAAAAKPAGGGVPGPKPRSDFTAKEKTAMLKRARVHAAEVEARKNK